MSDIVGMVRFDRLVHLAPNGEPELGRRVRRAVLVTVTLLWACLGIGIVSARAFAAEAEATSASFARAASVELADGTYQIAVELAGGTGRAQITSPSTLTVSDGRAVARIEWSSPHYDYMIVEGERYLPVNDEGNSVFEIPVLAYDEPMPVVADTTAMSVPHEIDYELTFDSTSIVAVSSGSRAPVLALVALGAVAAIVAVRAAAARTTRG